MLLLLARALETLYKIVLAIDESNINKYKEEEKRAMGFDSVGAGTEIPEKYQGRKVQPAYTEVKKLCSKVTAMTA